MELSPEFPGQHQAQVRKHTAWQGRRQDTSYRVATLAALAETWHKDSDCSIPRPGVTQYHAIFYTAALTAACSHSLNYYFKIFFSELLVGDIENNTMTSSYTIYLDGVLKQNCPTLLGLIGVWRPGRSILTRMAWTGYVIWIVTFTTYSHLFCK